MDPIPEQVDAAHPLNVLDTDASERAAEPTFEHVSVLNDFLDYCTRQGLLSRFEREILLRFKVDGLTDSPTKRFKTVIRY